VLNHFAFCTLHFALCIACGWRPSNAQTPAILHIPDQVRDQRITISGEDVRHIATVLRMKTGDELLLWRRAGDRVYCPDRAGRKERAHCGHYGAVEARAPLSSHHSRQGLPKSDKMDWIVQKATELGVAVIVPIVTERTIVKVKDEGSASHGGKRSRAKLQCRATGRICRRCRPLSLSLSCSGP